MMSTKKEKNTYAAEVKCHKCKLCLTHANIPYGISIEEHLYDNKCPYCGYYIIRRKKKR